MRTAPSWRIVSVCLAIGLAPVACSSPPVAEDAGDLDRLRVESGIAVFGDGDDQLAAIDDGEFVIMSLTGAERSRLPLTEPVTAVIADGDGGFWLLGHDWAGHWQGEAIACTVDEIGDGATILSVDDGGELLLAREVYIDGSGVQGETLRIDAGCGLQRSPMVQPPVTAQHRWEDGSSLVALGALIKAGPTQRAGPTLQIRDGDDVVDEALAFQDRPAAERVIALLVHEDRALVLAGNGDFAVHGLPSLAELGADQLVSPAHWLLPIGDTGHVIAGRFLIDMNTASVRPFLADGAVHDVTSDQAWWLVDDGDALELRRDTDLDLAFP